MKGISSSTWLSIIDTNLESLDPLLSCSDWEVQSEDPAVWVNKWLTVNVRLIQELELCQVNSIGSPLQPTHIS